MGKAKTGIGYSRFGIRADKSNNRHGETHERGTRFTTQTRTIQ